MRSTFDIREGSFSKPSSESSGISGWSCGGYSEGESSLCGNGELPTSCSKFSDEQVVANFLSLVRSTVLSSEKPEASPPTEELGGGSLSLGLSGGSLSVRGRVPTKSWD